jgi:hypothetical protein
MTARRVPPSRGPARPLRPNREKDIESDLRQARASRRADAQQKNRLRRQDWDDEDEAELGPESDGGPDDREADDTRGDDTEDERP